MRRKQTFLIALLVLGLACGGCAAPPTYADARATAQVAHCWPGNMATPPAVTVTPPGGNVATPAATITTLPGTPTATRWPTVTRLPPARPAPGRATTTPYPRCTPGPGEPTLIPFPTPVPPRPPYPTREPKLRQGGSDAQTTLLLPGRAYAIDLAVHPTEGWPVVGVMQRFSLSSDPIQSFVRVFNPISGTWGPAQQVDIGESSNGMDRNGSTVVGITGDRTVLAVWGGSDKTDMSEGGLWTSASRDFGATWSTPQRIADNCALALDMATTAQGYVVVLANCYRRVGAGAILFAALLVRHPDGVWDEAVRLEDVGATFGAVAIVGDGADATAYALTTAHPSQGNPRTLYLLSKRLADSGGWTVQTRDFAVAGIDSTELGDFGINVRGLTFARGAPGQPPQPGLAFMFSGRYRASAYALTSLDGGQSWGQVEAIAHFSGASQDTGRELAYVTPAYDVAADRLIAVWVCCGADAATHYASWSVPGSGVWQPAQGPARYDTPIPVILGSRAAAMTVSAQVANGRVTWVAWVEQDKRVEVRSLNLNQLIPIDQYPTPLPPTVTATTGVTP